MPDALPRCCCGHFVHSVPFDYCIPSRRTRYIKLRNSGLVLFHLMVGVMPFFVSRWTFHRVAAFHRYHLPITPDPFLFYTGGDRCCLFRLFCLFILRWFSMFCAVAVGHRCLPDRRSFLYRGVPFRCLERCVAVAYVSVLFAVYDFSPSSDTLFYSVRTLSPFTDLLYIRYILICHLHLHSFSGGWVWTWARCWCVLRASPCGGYGWVWTLPLMRAGGDRANSGEQAGVCRALCLCILLFWNELHDFSPLCAILINCSGGRRAVGWEHGMGRHGGAWVVSGCRWQAWSRHGMGECSCLLWARWRLYSHILCICCYYDVRPFWLWLFIPLIVLVFSSVILRVTFWYVLMTDTTVATICYICSFISCYIRYIAGILPFLLMTLGDGLFITVVDDSFDAVVVGTWNLIRYLCTYHSYDVFDLSDHYFICDIDTLYSTISDEHWALSFDGITFCCVLMTVVHCLYFICWSNVIYYYSDRWYSGWWPYSTWWWETGAKRLFSMTAATVLKRTAW